MSETYETTLDDLRREIASGSARPAMIDELIARLFHDPSAIRPGDFLSLCCATTPNTTKAYFR